MQFVCDAPCRRSWFRIETESEAEREAQLMSHKVDKYFRAEEAAARASYQPTSPVYIEQQIGLKAHLQRAMPLFLTLRDVDGGGLATAMLPPAGNARPDFRIIIVGSGNADPYPGAGDAIAALGSHFGLILDRDHCFPYGR
ncbi:MAG: hypothetical protein EXQ87_11125 [Alphaproteobacteria bacterium]|nr:hypothetical protein [Alphaproteobacteria bacterium]